ncbi:PTS system mannose/fructose/sorbose family transporter subunit IID, partial [Turicibacter sanguinis]|nr:PTS system mannose/fructose/sorbose family transporter subunit IID [Turicibacter sanguinis]MTN13567.1 PTS system mannose/fructose/sorbose family transporter subunit IID [Turicibacter sanguinis]
VGALIASYVGVPITAEIPNGESVIVVQEILDGIMPCLLPLGLTFGLYALVKRGASPLVNIAILVVIGLLGAFIGLF